MKNVRNICFTFLVITVLCYVRADESVSEDDGFQLRFGRRSKQPENTSESVKKQKNQQKQEDLTAVTRSQLTPSSTNELTSLQMMTDVASVRNLLQNGPLQVRFLDNQLNGGILPSYAFNYPYQQGYPPQQIPAMANQGYLYGNPAVDQVNNLLGQQPQLMPDLMNGQQSIANSYAPNFMGGLSGHTFMPQQVQLPHQHSYGNNLMDANGFAIGQPGLQNNHGLHGQPGMPPAGYPNIFNNPGQLPGMSFGPLPGAPGLPGLPPHPGQELQFNYPLGVQQPQLLSPVLGSLPSAVPPQNGLNNGIGGIFPPFIRNQRSFEQNADEE